ncbi:MAG: adenylyltransferase/cytidyltransferase family protein [Thermonemataceae bacterium]|nr:adenylyltransferase/cytidyltransferase family protein [Thermonemataceae bacterium]
MIDYKVYQPLFEAYKIQNWQLIQQAWQEKHRFYHNEEHLAFLLEKIEKSSYQGQEQEILLLVAFFHDIVYQATYQDNEERSVDIFEQICQADDTVKRQVRQLILDTKTHQPSDDLSTFFCEIDTAIVHQSSFVDLLHWEKQIFKEYQCYEYNLYREGRISVLEKFKKRYPQNQENIDYLIAYLRQFRPKIGVYPGSFNPFHNGHLNILEKAEKVFDKVIIARGFNPEKDTFAADDAINEVLHYRQTENFQGLLTDYISSKEKCADVTLIRGLRNGDDLAYEMNQISFMNDLKPDLKVIFFHCDREYEHISSSAIRNLEKIGKDYSKKYLPTLK